MARGPSNSPIFEDPQKTVELVRPEMDTESCPCGEPVITFSKALCCFLASKKARCFRWHFLFGASRVATSCKRRVRSWQKKGNQKVRSKGDKVARLRPPTPCKQLPLLLVIAKIKENGRQRVKGVGQALPLFRNRQTIDLSRLPLRLQCRPRCRPLDPNPISRMYLGSIHLDPALRVKFSLPRTGQTKASTLFACH